MIVYEGTKMQEVPPEDGIIAVQRLYNEGQKAEVISWWDTGYTFLLTEGVTHQIVEMVGSEVEIMAVYKEFKTIDKEHGI